MITLSFTTRFARRFAHRSLGYFEAQKMPCPKGYNLADHVMDLLVVDSGVENSTRKTLIEAWDSDKVKAEAEGIVAKLGNRSGSISGVAGDDGGGRKSKWNSSYLTQLKVCFY